jgi:Protein of unknown function (DUF1878)
MNDLEKEINTLKFHQKLLVKAIRNEHNELDLLFVEKNVSEEEANEIIKICEELSKQFEIEKAEGYINFQPLLKQLVRKLNRKVLVQELIEACLLQGLFIPFMKEMKRELNI